MTTPTPRPHAELAARYYADASLKCWFKNSVTLEWDLLVHPSWQASHEYHVGHEPPLVRRTFTLTVNGRTWVLPEPLREAPKFGGTYWYLDWVGIPSGLTWSQNEREEIALDKGLLYATEADAQQWTGFDAWCRGGEPS